MPEAINFVDLNIDDAVDQIVLPEDKEFELQIMKSSFIVSDKEGVSNLIRVILECPSEETSKAIGHTLWMPGVGDTKRQRNGALLGIRNFCKNFNITFPGKTPVSEMDEALIDWKGASGFWTLKITGANEEEQYNDLKQPCGVKKAKASKAATMR